MKYLLSIYGDESQQHDMPPEQVEPYMQEWFQYDAQLREAVTVLSGEALELTGTAKTVRHRDGDMVTLDGPFAETKEQLGGFYLIDVDDIQTALEWAGKMPSVKYGGSVEVRPVQVFEQ